MDERDTRQIRETIEGEVERLKVEIVRLQELVKPVAPDNAIGRLSRLDNMVNQEVSSRGLALARTRLVKLQWMLEHVDDEGFGSCRECGDDIPLARLLAVPESGLCLECAEEAQ